MNIFVVLEGVYYELCLHTKTYIDNVEDCSLKSYTMAMRNFYVQVKPLWKCHKYGLEIN